MKINFQISLMRDGTLRIPQIMKKRLRAVVICAAFLVCCAGIFMPARKTEAAKAKKYYLMTMYDDSGEVYLKSDKVVLKGPFKKSGNLDSLSSEKVKNVNFKSKTFKLSKNCKISEFSDVETAYSYWDYITRYDISPTKSTKDVVTVICVKNGKVTKVSFSA